LTQQDKNPKPIEIESYPLWGIVKERLTNESKSKKSSTEQHPALKKLMELTQKARMKDSPSQLKNPEEVPVAKELHRSMELQVQNLRQEISKEGKTGR
jgi:hypothetical protein